MTPLALVLRVLLGLALACGAVVPGPCTFDPRRDFDCNLAEPCDENFACAVDGFCKSADIACLDGQARCEVPAAGAAPGERVGLCVAEEDFATSKSHCGLCFQHCLGAGTCVEGACVGAPPAGECLPERGHFDCSQSEQCEDGRCLDGERGRAGLGEACEQNRDCQGGLCVDGGPAQRDGRVCSSPCDFGCAFGFFCDQGGAPGGLCVPREDEVCR